MRIYPRESYLAKLRPFYDSDVIKVITGIRRCGKSCLLLSIMDELRERGVPEDHIVYLNLDRREFRKVRSDDDLDAEIERRMPSCGMRYLFVDEVQNVDGFEPVINGWREEGDVSVFLTGSNSYLLSGELVTKLTGRYMEFEMYTLDYAEWLGMREFLGLPLPASYREGIDEYLTYGGFPKTLEFADPATRQEYVRNVMRQIIEKDIKRRVKIRNMDVFERVMAYVVNNFAAPTNAANIADHFTNAERFPVRRETVKRYLDILESAKVVCKCTRFDMKTRRSLGAQEKYYLSDIGIYCATNTDNRINYGPALENVTYTYLRARGYEVSVGKIGKLECDFITRRANSYGYVQVAFSIADRKVEEREYRPFSYIRDGYPRYLFTLDPLLQQRDGVRHLNLVDFMATGLGLEDVDTSHPARTMVVKAAINEISENNTALADQIEGPTDQVTDQDAKLSDQEGGPVSRLLDALGDEELSALALMERLGLSHRATFRQNYLNPALGQKLIERTVPDRPNSRNQRYRKRGE